MSTCYNLWAIMDTSIQECNGHKAYVTWFSPWYYNHLHGLVYSLPLLITLDWWQLLLPTPTVGYNCVPLDFFHAAKIIAILSHPISFHQAWDPKKLQTRAILLVLRRKIGSRRVYIRFGVQTMEAWNNEVALIWCHFPS